MLNGKIYCLYKTPTCVCVQHYKCCLLSEKSKAQAVVFLQLQRAGYIRIKPTSLHVIRHKKPFGAAYRNEPPSPCSYCRRVAAAKTWQSPIIEMFLFLCFRLDFLTLCKSRILILCRTITFSFVQFKLFRKSFYLRYLRKS